MGLNREHVVGAIRVLNAAEFRCRVDALRKMLLVDFAPAKVESILLDLPSYPEWNARVDLDATPEADG